MIYIYTYIQIMIYADHKPCHWMNVHKQQLQPSCNCSPKLQPSRAGESGENVVSIAISHENPPQVTKKTSAWTLSLVPQKTSTGHFSGPKEGSNLQFSSSLQSAVITGTNLGSTETERAPTPDRISGICCSKLCIPSFFPASISVISVFPLDAQKKRVQVVPQNRFELYKR